MRLTIRWTFVTAVLAAAACSDSAGPSQRPAADLNIVKSKSGQATFADTVVSFWARQGSGSEGRLYFAAADGSRGEEFARLTLKSGSLLRRPDGTLVLPGDSVLITMRVPDPGKLLVEFTPTGLVFDPAEPAELRMRFSEGSDDLNGDGTVNGRDTTVQDSLAIWRQEVPGTPYVRLNSSLLLALKESDAPLLGFTRYALAY